MLLLSSLPKIRQPYDFLGNVYGYELVGAKLGMLVAIALPWLELVLGLCLISGLFLSGALLGCIILMGTFVFVQSFALHRGLAISCGCFQTGGTDMIGYGTLIRTVLLLMAAVLGYVLLLSRSRVTPQQSEPPKQGMQAGESTSRLGVASGPP